MLHRVNPGKGAQKILDQYPPPALNKSMELDDYVAEILSGLNSNYGKPYDDILSTIQGRIGKFMDPLGKLWLDFDNLRKGNSSDILWTFMIV